MSSSERMASQPSARVARTEETPPTEQSARAIPFPSSVNRADWIAFFKTQTPSHDDVRRQVSKLHQQKKYEEVIALIEAALISGRAQAWMHEILAMEMSIVGRPDEEIERVTLSVADFGRTDFTSLMYAGAYLTSFKRPEAALKIYRQASELAPERPEPYTLGLKLARSSKSPEDMIWAAAGILEYGWVGDVPALHKDAENAIVEAERLWQRSGQTTPPPTVQPALQQARIRDLQVSVNWIGSADLDLSVEEPSGTICSFKARLSPGGGNLLRDGFGPNSKNCHEEYICPRGMTGEYRIVVQKISGDVVGNRVEIVTRLHVGTDKEQTTRETLKLEENRIALRVSLDQGRRQQLRQLSALPQRFEQQLANHDPRVVRFVVNGKMFRPGPAGVVMPAGAVADPAAAIQQAAAEFGQSRQVGPGGGGAGTGRPFVTGVTGYQPIIQYLQTGASINAAAVVSPDRRYVRMAISPTFNALTEVATFTFLGQ